MSNFDEDEELEEKLKMDPRELDEDELQDVQIYKSQKLKALRDSGESGDQPDWWDADAAPETLGGLAGTVGAGGEAPSGDSGAEEAEEEAEEEEVEEEEESDAEAEEAEEDTEEEETAEEEPAEPESTETQEDREPATAKEGVPQVGWSQGIPETDEVDFDNEILEGVYQRQDEIMDTLQALSQGMSEVDVGGEAIDSIQESLNDLNDRVADLAENAVGDDLEQKINEIHEVISTTREMETKIAELPPLPEEDELVEAGIIDKPVEHDGSDTCFTTSVDGRKAALHYGVNPDRLTAYHFSLPTVLSETVKQTVEDVLARALFDHAREEELLVHPQAARLRSGFLARHPEYYEVTPDSVKERHRV